MPSGAPAGRRCRSMRTGAWAKRQRLNSSGARSRQCRARMFSRVPVLSLPAGRASPARASRSSSLARASQTSSRSRGRLSCTRSGRRKRSKSPMTAARVRPEKWNRTRSHREMPLNSRLCNSSVRAGPSPAGRRTQTPLKPNTRMARSSRTSPEMSRSTRYGRRTLMRFCLRPTADPER